MNSGHLLRLIRAEYLLPAVGLNKIAGEPFRIAEIESRINEILGEPAHAATHR
jgi:2-oxoglutarate ferredoxin oxidoreductase subunit alpha